MNKKNRTIQWMMVSLLVTKLVQGQEVTIGKFEYLKGSVHTYPITMSLCSGITETSAYYHYERYQRPLGLVATKEGERGRLHLVGADDFSLQVTQDGYTGLFKAGEKAKELKVDLKRTTPAVPFTVYEIKQEYFPTANKDSGAFCKYTMSLVWPEGSDARSAFVADRIAREVFGHGVPGKNIRDSLTALSRAYIEDYREARKGVSMKELEESSVGYTQENIQDVTAIFFSPNLMVLTFLSYEYTGGAHGNADLGYVNLDLKNLKEIRFDDVFTKSGRKSLPRLLENAFRIDKKLKPGQPLSDGGLFEDHIEEASQNILVNTKGVVFHYGQYAIAPYSEGMVELFVSYAELKPYLTPSFAKRLAEGL